MIKDISLTLERAILLSNEYHSELISHEIEKITNIWCRLEDDSSLNWYLISKSTGKSVEKYYGYLSRKFPVALLMKDCPNDVRNLLLRNGILLEKYCERYSCEQTVLKQYIENKVLIDDRFLYDENIPFDEETFFKIDEGIQYINPYNFTFDEIK